MESIHNLILNLDEGLLLFINSLHSPFGDIVMWKFSARFFWIPFYVFLLYLLIKKIGIQKSIVCIIILALMIFATDQIGASILRPSFERLRPSSPMNPISDLLVFVNEYRGGDFGFPSCHAANTFALFMFLSNILKSNWIKCTLLFWAILVSFSRIYLGVHYPTDILAGAILGSAIGYIFYVIFDYSVNYNYSRLFNVFRR